MSPFRRLALAGFTADVFFFAADLRAGFALAFAAAFFAGAFFTAGFFFTATFLAATFFAAGFFFTATFLAAAFFGVAFFATDFFAAGFAPADEAFLAATFFVAVDFLPLAGLRSAATFLTAFLTVPATVFLVARDAGVFVLVEAALVLDFFMVVAVSLMMAVRYIGMSVGVPVRALIASAL